MLSIDNFDYFLPEERIASIPASLRSDSKLLRCQMGSITDHRFSEIGNLLPKDSLLIFNNSKVIPARLLFNRPSGARIEILLLEPFGQDPATAMLSTGTSSWQCMIGNRKKWKQEEVLNCTGNDNVVLSARLIDDAKVEFSWSPKTMTFETILNRFGNIPLPPYLNRNVNETDRERYQTIYASVPGAVAAPTAGLHFTPQVLDAIKSHGHKTDYLTLHVGAGTFLPVKTTDALKHTMHAEIIIFSRAHLINLINHQGPVIAVGTTAMRSLESIYWIGVNYILNHVEPHGSRLVQDFPYHHYIDLPTTKEVLMAMLNYMDKRNMKICSAATSIYIHPGYGFKICKGLITNFHQPKSTLLLLIAALMGDDWRKVYNHALNNDYRFLSYGDSSLLLPN